MSYNPHFSDDMGMNLDGRFQVVSPGFEMSNFIRSEVTANPPTNFLHLPEGVRIRIYQYSNLIRSCPIDVFRERSRQKGNGDFCGWHLKSRAPRLQLRSPIVPCNHPAIPLRVSHAVFEDASSALYSHNQFRLMLKVDDFEKFKRVTKPYLHLIQSLHVELCTYHNQTLHLRNVSENPLQSVLRRWERFCGSVPRTIPGLKDFSLECRIRDAETAKKVLSQMKSFPLLRQCAFYFHPLADRETLSIARETAYARTLMIRASPTPFQFLDLPVELQLMVMEHLLIYQWDPFVPLLPVCLPRRLSEGQILLQKHMRHDPSQLICCASCSKSTSLCFCSVRNTTFSTYCSCFTISPGYVHGCEFGLFFEEPILNTRRPSADDASCTSSFRWFIWHDPAPHFCFLDISPRLWYSFGATIWLYNTAFVVLASLLSQRPFTSRVM
jgi:hypothetical protein